MDNEYGDRVAAGFAAGDEDCVALVSRRWRPLVHALARRSPGARPATSGRPRT
ncbi:hypothetical protein [Streptomyces sp. ISL-66]|uniref:hypothetical protein n=1 Tax=Streptomyces sp. ISL-66 TaxID=2819186 RepID=UPI0035B445AD